MENKTIIIKETYPHRAVIARTHPSGLREREYVIPAIKKTMSAKSATRLIKGVMYDLDKPYIVEGRKPTDFEEALRQALHDALSYVSYRGDHYKSVTFDMPNVQEALKKGKTKHFDIALSPDEQARYDAKHVSQQEAR
jgi:hypothetical protein